VYVIKDTAAAGCRELFGPCNMNEPGQTTDRQDFGAATHNDIEIEKAHYGEGGRTRKEHTMGRRGKGI